MPRRLSSKYSTPSTTCTTTTSSIEVRFPCGSRGFSSNNNLDLKPENLLYLTPAHSSSLVLADFGIAKMLDSSSEVLTTMAGSFGYAAPEVMLKHGHGKPVDMWSLGVITYTLLCGYSPFRSENLPDLIEECRHGRIVFHERYWKDVSPEAKAFIKRLLEPDPDKRYTSVEAMKDVWLTGTTASDKDILPELRAYMAKARLKRGIEIVRLANRIEALKMQEDDAGILDPNNDVPADAKVAAGDALQGAGTKRGSLVPSSDKGLETKEGRSKGRLSRAARGAIFREVVLAKVRELKREKELKGKKRVGS
jgi:calcium/calmodulin-dependent protein kinase I